MALFGLLVGVNDYRPPVSKPLRGPVNDIQHWCRYLTERFGADTHLVTLVDAAATRAAVVEGFRNHLAQAQPGDTALFVFSGHGSQEQPPAELSHRDGSGKLQNLLLFDTGQVVEGHLCRQLADKELSLLLHEVSRRGPHVVAVLDCCHSGDATRSGADTTRQWDPTIGAGEAERAGSTQANVLLELWGPRPLEEFLEGTVEHFRSGESPGHVAMTACQATETAREREVAGRWRGLFTVGILDALEAEAVLDYRCLTELARSRLVAFDVPQRPELYPLDAGGPADGLFLDGVVGVEPAPFVMSTAGSGWTVNAGTLHGLGPPAGGDACRLACIGGDGKSLGEVRVLSAEPASCRVEPVRWEPHAASYRARISWAPAAVVAFGEPEGPVEGAEEAGEAAAAYATIRQALEASSSPLLRLAATGESVLPGEVKLRVVLRPGPPPHGPTLEMSVATAGAPFPLTWSDPGRDAPSVVQRLEHLARWERLRWLGEQRSELAGAVELQVYPAAPQDRVLPPGVKPLANAREHALTYSGATPPRVFLRLCNTAPRDLWVALVDLADDLSARPLIQAQLLAAGVSVDVDSGRCVEFLLPEGMAVAPGATTRDHLKVLVSDVRFEAGALALAALGQTTRSGEEPSLVEWAATTTTMIVTVPA